MISIFDVVPNGFFNCLASGSNNRIYADCLLLIYNEYENEISYRLPRDQIRDVIAYYLNDINASSLIIDEDIIGKSENDMAGNIIRKFIQVGWLEEEVDDATYQRQIIISENGILLAEFMERLQNPKENSEFVNYIFNIYSRLIHEEQWKNNPYTLCLLPVYEESRNLSKALKKLSTFIRKTIEDLMKESSFKSLTENIIEYYDGSFIKEFSRLLKTRSIYAYRPDIISHLEEFKNESYYFDALVNDYMNENGGVEYYDAETFIIDMIEKTIKFIGHEYDVIINDIKTKIILYLQIAIARGRFLRNQDTDIRGNVEQTLRYIINEMEEFEMKDDIPDEMMDLFALETNDFIDLNSLWYKGKERSIKTPVRQIIEQLSDEDILQAKKKHKMNTFDPFSKDKAKAYLDIQMAGKTRIASTDLPLNTKDELLLGLSAVAYSNENGYKVMPIDGYLEVNNMVLKSFEIRRIDE